MTFYRKADPAPQWFATAYPGVKIIPDKGLLHTTETRSWPTYKGGASAPNYTARPDFITRELRWRVHFPDEMSSRALQNAPGGVETNHDDVVQVELVGTCDPDHRYSWDRPDGTVAAAGSDYLFWPDAPDWALNGVAWFMVDQALRHGTPIQSGLVWNPYPKSYGYDAPQRMSFDAWRAFKGWCGHQHVPENDHGDPGDIDIGTLLATAKSLLPTPKDGFDMATIEDLKTALKDPDVLREQARFVLTGYPTAGADGTDRVLAGRLTTVEAMLSIINGNVLGLSLGQVPDIDLNAIATAVADEQARRLVS